MTLPAQPGPPEGRGRPWFKWFGITLLASAYLVSIVYISQIRSRERGPGSESKVVIRLAHSLMENSVQEAFNRIAQKYETLHPDVKIVVQAIPKRAYKQWLNTQLIGDSPPDLIQIDEAGNIATALRSKHAEIITMEVGEENPYNLGTPMAGVPWRDTYVDGMQGGYDNDLLEFYSVPLTLNTSRLFYNKDLFRAALGHDRPPATFSELIKTCAAIRAYGRREGREIFPIAATREDARQQGLLGYYLTPLTAGMLMPYEHHAEGVSSQTITLFALMSGGFSFKNDRLRTAFELQRELAANFQPGFISDMADQTRFLFVQERAAMVAGITLDVMLYGKTANFEVGVFPMPLPTTDHPKYGRYIEGAVWEQAVSSFSFAVTKAGGNREKALDFIRFASSLKVNEAFCWELNWFPVVRTARPRENLEVFAPTTRGAAGEPIITTGPDLNLYYDQNYLLYLGGTIDFDTFMDGLEKLWLTKGREWTLVRRDEISKRNLHASERTLARSRVKMLFEEAGEFLPGKAMGSGTQYQIGTYIVLAHFAAAFTYRQYIPPHLEDGSLAMPPLSAMPDALLPFDPATGYSRKYRAPDIPPPPSLPPPAGSP